MDIITNVLYWLTTGLLVPVIVLLLLLFLRSLLLGGTFYGMYINRLKNKKQLTILLEDNEAGFLSQLTNEKAQNNPLFHHILLIKERKGSQASVDKTIGDYEILADRDLGKSKLLTKLGPILGLMGTLIPMGPALVGLATGDVSTMAHNMQVAFATTVVGVFVGAIGFVTQQIKQRWYADDMNTLEYVAGVFAEKKQL